MPEKITCRLKFLKEETPTKTFYSIRDAWWYLSTTSTRLTLKNILLSKLYRALRGPGYLDFGIDRETIPIS